MLTFVFFSLRSTGILFSLKVLDLMCRELTDDLTQLSVFQFILIVINLWLEFHFFQLVDDFFQDFSFFEKNRKASLMLKLAKE